MKRYLIVILAALLLLCGTVCAAAEDSEAPAPQVMTTADQSTPRLMVTGYLLADAFMEPGSTAALTITFKNTSNTKSLRNMKFTLTDPSGELMPDGMGTLYVPFLAAGSTYNWNTALSAVYAATEGRHALEVSTEYEDAQFGSYSTQDTIYIHVRQPAKLSYDNAVLPGVAVQGDTLTLSINVMNTGKAPLSNVAVRCKIVGLAAGGSTFLSGPDRWLTDFENRKEEIRFTPSITIEYKILKYLSFRSTTGADYRSSNQYKWKSSRINSTAEGSIGAVAHSRTIYWNTNNMFNFFRKIGDHRINATAGVTLSSSGGSVETVEGWNIAQYKAKIDGINSAPNTSFRYTETDSHLASGLVRLIYNYHDRYVLTSTYRLDGSSKFQGKNKWASFPSFAFAWRANQEKWFRVPVISMLKLRAGWGRVGNQAITSYQTQSTYDFGTYPSHEAGNDAHFSVSMYPTNVANPKLKWETTEQTNVGLDFGMWDGRFTLTADLYYKNTFDLLQNKIIPGSSGYTNMWMNMGSITNKGLELTIDATPLKFGGFEWQIGGNITFNKNRIRQIGEGSEGDEIFLSPGVREYRNFFYGDKIGYGSYCNAPLNIFIEGEPMSIFYGYKSAGIVQEGEEGIPVAQGGTPRDPGSVQYLDLDGNGYLDDYDRTIIGDPNPKFTFGFNTAFTYRGFTLSANFVGSYGNDIYNVNEVMNTDIATLGVNIRKDAYYKAWTPENMSQKFPALGKYEGFDLKVMSDRFVEDGSYLRLSNVSFSYDFVFKKNNVIKGLNLGVTGSNLYIWTKYSGFDPDVNSYGSAWRKGADMGSYPGARSVTVNVRFTF